LAYKSWIRLQQLNAYPKLCVTDMYSNSPCFLVCEPGAYKSWTGFNDWEKHLELVLFCSEPCINEKLLLLLLSSLGSPTCCHHHHIHVKLPCIVLVINCIDVQHYSNLAKLKYWIEETIFTFSRIASTGGIQSTMSPTMKSESQHERAPDTLHLTPGRLRDGHSGRARSANGIHHRLNPFEHMPAVPEKNIHQELCVARHSFVGHFVEVRIAACHF